MIPKHINREHIINAIEETKRYGIPRDRISRKYLLAYAGEFYPPKHIISLANKYAIGNVLNPSLFSGGMETNEFLNKLGFKIVKTPSVEKSFSKIPNQKKKMRYMKSRHNERCPKCKEVIGMLLEKVYGHVETNYKFKIGAHPEDFKNTSNYEKIKEIYMILQSHRGFKDFVKTRTLPNCDFFIPKPGFILEFDESQHFTKPRSVALTKYPKDLKLGFDKEKWIKRCLEIKAEDNNPPYRDEQRAWYDALRDFLPTIKGLKPTIRLFANDFVWCSLDPNNLVDVKRFENFLKRKADSRDLEVREGSNTFLARIIICSEWAGEPEKAKKLLEDIYKQWPKDKKVKFVVTCGGFIQFDWPKSISWQDIGDNRYPNRDIVEALVKEAEKCAKFILSDGLDRKLGEFTNYITLGIDSFKEKISTTQNYIGQPHIELVFLIDLKHKKFYWTGKSYPTSNQQNGLVRITDLKKHFFELRDVGKVMILGCHDLTIFNPRSGNAKGWRKRVNKDFRELAKQEKPNIVLQHPHTTDSILTWSAAWNALVKELPTVEIYSSAGRYFNPEGERSKLNYVLERTKHGNSIDFIV